MGIGGAFVCFAVTWFLALYCLLPIGVRSVDEVGDARADGAMSGAPSNPNIGMKALGATVISAVLTALIGWGVNTGVISLATIDRLMGVTPQ